jgi:chorismate mutase
MKRILLLLMLSAGLSACKPAPAPDQTFDDLLVLMRSRLEVMHDVARWKWAARSPIEDPVREAALLVEVAAQGKALGLDPEATRAFFLGQIEAAKVVQKTDFRRWEEDQHGPEGKAPDLANVLRPRIDALNRDLLGALARAEPRLRNKKVGAAALIRRRADELLNGNGIDGAVRDAAIQPLLDAS